MRRQLESRQLTSDGAPSLSSRPHFADPVFSTNVESATDTTLDGLSTATTHPEYMSRSHNLTGILPTQPIMPQLSGPQSHSAFERQSSLSYNQHQDILDIASESKLDGVELTVADVKDLFAE